MSLSTDDVKTACFSYLFSLFLYLSIELLVQLSVLLPCLEYLFVIGVGVACGFNSLLFCVAVLLQSRQRQIFSVAAQCYIRTASRHVGSDGHSAELARLCDYHSFLVVILCVQYIVLYALLFQQF